MHERTHSSKVCVCGTTLLFKNEFKQETIKNAMWMCTIQNNQQLDKNEAIIFDNKNLTIINDSKSTSFASSENLLKSLKTHTILD